MIMTTGEHAGLTFSISVQVDDLGRVSGSGVLPRQTRGSPTIRTHFDRRTIRTMSVTGSSRGPAFDFTLHWPEGAQRITCAVEPSGKMSGKVLTGSGAGERVELRRDESSPAVKRARELAVAGFRPGDPVECYSKFDGGWVDQLVV